MKHFKKTIPALLAGAAALASCTRELDAPTPFNGDNEIAFGSRGVLVETKTFVETTNELLQAGGFKAAAVIDGDNSTMFNAAVAYESGDGVYRVPENHYYYPISGTMSFYGVYPASQDITLSDGIATLVYTQDAETDLVGVAVRNVAKRNTAVQMDFAHLLSQVTVRCKGHEKSVDYKVTSIVINNADGGTYSYDDDSWTGNTTLADYAYLDAATSISTDAMTGVGSPMSFVPGDIGLTVAWECYNKGSGTLISENEETVSVKLTKGKHTSINITLPSNTSEIMLDTDIDAWISEDNDINLASEAKYAVNVTKGSIVTLPKLTVREGTIGEINWGDGTIEPIDNVGTKSDISGSDVIFSHQYAAAFNGGVSFSLETGKIYGEVSPDELERFTISNPAKVSITKSVVFTVNDLGKKVKFAKGNLYWDGSAFHCEESTFDLHDSNSADHISYFFWSTDARVAYADNYYTAKSTYGITPGSDETIFAADGGAIEGWTVLSIDEWRYLGLNALAKNSSLNNNIIIDGKDCIVLKPDGFFGTLADTYTAEEWAEAESQYGLLALPFKINSSKYLNFWLSKSESDTKAYVSSYDKTYFNGVSDYRSRQNAIRLVQVVSEGKESTADAVYKVRASAGSTVTLPELDITPGTKGSVDWGDGTKEPFGYEATKSSVAGNKVTLSHDYVSSFRGNAEIFIQEGGISGQVRTIEYTKFIIKDKTKVVITTQPGFIVNESGKAVTLAPGNLYWNGTEFKFEEHQYDYPATWDASHVGHFAWSKDAMVAYAENNTTARTKYNDLFGEDDMFFAADGNVFEGFTVLSIAEWRYLYDHTEGKKLSTVAGNVCVVLKPVGVDATIADSYSAEKWAAAEGLGLVALPYAGERTNTSISGKDIQGYYSSSSVNNPSTGVVWYARFDTLGGLNSSTANRNNGHSIRLVQIYDEGE